MSTASLVNRIGDPIADSLLEPFQATFRGLVIRPADGEYEAARRIWNASIDRRPGLIVRCTGLADVIAAVNFARDHELLVAIRGGGHNVGGRALCDGGMVIDLSRMKGIHVDAEAKRVRVQPGVLLGELDRETHVYGMAVPAGVVSRTGIAGLTLGGGVGWLARKYGLTCDNVISFEIVTADGAVRRVSADEHPGPLLGAARRRRQLRRRHLVRVQAAPGQHGTGRHGRVPARARDRAAEVLPGLHRRRAGRTGHLFRPDQHSRRHTGDGVRDVLQRRPGHGREGPRADARAGSPLMDVIAPIPFPQMQTLLDAAVPDGNQNYWKSAFLKDLNDDAIDTIVQHANQATSPMTAVLIEQYGGAASRISPDATAFSQRQAQYDLGILAQWADPATPTATSRGRAPSRRR